MQQHLQRTGGSSHSERLYRLGQGQGIPDQSAGADALADQQIESRLEAPAARPILNCLLGPTRGSGSDPSRLRPSEAPRHSRRLGRLGRNLVGACFPGAIEIIDLFHAHEHLWEVARSIYGPDTDLATQWARRRCDDLEAGRMQTLLTALDAQVPRCDQTRKCLA